MRFRIIYVACACQADCQCLFRLRDRQRSVLYRDLVVRGHIRLARLDFHIVLRRDRAGVLTRVDPARAELHIVRMSADQALALFGRCHSQPVDRDRASRVCLRFARPCEGHWALRDRQRSRCKGLCLICFRYIIAGCIYNRIGFRKGTGIRTARDIRPLRRSVCDLQLVSGCQAFNSIAIGADGVAGTCYCRNEAAAFLYGAVVYLFDILDCNFQCGFRNFQFSEFFNYGIVIGINSSPINAVGVFCFTRSGNCACSSDDYLLFIRRNQSGDACFILGKRCSVICLFRTSGCDCYFLGKNLQSAGTDKQADAVVVIIRKICNRQLVLIEIVVVSGIAFFDADILLSCCCLIIFSLGLLNNRFPDIIQILCFIAFMSDNDIVFYTLVWICETSLFYGPVIDIAGPAVWLDTNSYVDFCNFQCTADVTDRIVIAEAILGDAVNCRTSRGNLGGACIHPSITGIIVYTSICVLYT